MTKCIGCSRDFQSQNSLKSHKRFCSAWQEIKHLHKKPKPQTREVVKSIPSTCDVCGKVFKNVYSMSAHKAHCTGANTTKQLKPFQFTGETKGTILKSKDEIFTSGSTFRSTYVKKALYYYDLASKECSHCGISEWNGKPIVLELDHIDGDNRNNVLENLRVLCPNCHSQTPTFRGKNKSRSSDSYVSDDELQSALDTTPSIRQALLKVGLSAKGGNYARCYRLLEQSTED